jgi:hypothetical protein
LVSPPLIEPNAPQTPNGDSPPVTGVVVAVIVPELIVSEIKRTEPFPIRNWLIISYFGGSFDYNEYWHFCPARDNILVENEVD